MYFSYPKNTKTALNVKGRRQMSPKLIITIRAHLNIIHINFQQSFPVIFGQTDHAHTRTNILDTTSGPKFTDDLRIILRQFSDLRQFMTTGEFTEHLEQS